LNTVLVLAAHTLAGCTKVTPVEEITAVSAADLPVLPEPRFSDDDWPWWRGPTRNGIAPATSAAPVAWSESRNVVWKTEVSGRGNSSPTVVGDRVYPATADEAKQTQTVLCFDRATGNGVWQKDLHQGGFPSAMHPNSTHANGTIACDGERLFIAFLHDNAIHAYALSLDGDLVWQQKLGAFTSQFGYAPSPCVWKSLVLFAADNRGGGWLAAVHRQTGDIVWRKGRPAISTYSSPVVASVAGRDQLLISGAGHVTSFDPGTGAELWSCAGTTEATVGTAVWDAERVFASGGYPGRQTIAVSAGKGKEAWSNAQHAYEPSLLLTDGHLYCTGDGGIACCWDAATGKEKWKKRLGGKFSASPVLSGGKIYATNEAGTTFVLQADPSRFELVAENQLGAESFATPTICGGRIYHRVREGSGGTRREVLYCIGDTGETQAAGG
jgi:outer membrane protein assembly factor BamB